MPKVKLVRDAQAERCKTIRTIIKAKQAMRDIKTQSDLAVACGIYPTTFSYKLRNGAWTCDDIRALDKVLRFSMDEIVQIVRC